MKKLIPAIVMLLVSAVVLSTASYAWFTTSEAVQASGMQVTAQAPTSILISGYDDVTDTDAPTWLGYKSSVTFPAEKHNLYASSSKDGKNFFKPEQCEDISGAMKYGTHITDVSAASNEGTYYVDYKVRLQNTSNSHQAVIKVDSIKIDENLIKGAIRVAIINEKTGESYVYLPGNVEDYVQRITSTGTYADDVEGALAGTYLGLDESGTKKGTYATFEEAVVGADVNFSTLGTTEIAVIDPLDPSISVDDIENAQNYVQLTIRIWIEGQSSACVTANAGLGSAVAIQFGIARTVAAPQQ